MNHVFLFTISLLIILILVILKISQIRNISLNHSRHKDNDSRYAHFSKIDSDNFMFYPSLALTSPKRYILNPGECLSIPAKWWHWIKTPIRTYSINFWFKEKILSSPNKDIYTNPIDFSSLDPIEVVVWNTNNPSNNYKTIFSDFIRNNNEDEYIITVSDYTIFKDNTVIKDILKPQIFLPSSVSSYKGVYDYNVWVTSNKTETGLHYDDDDGILCCIEGKKEIILYPPGDTKYLHPFKTRDWLKNKALNFRYNSYRNMGTTVEGLPSSNILFRICRKYDKILDIIDNFFEKNGTNKTVWGFKKDISSYRLEFYEYNLSGNPVVASTDILFDSPHIGEKRHYYHKFSGQNIELPFWGHGTYKLNNKIYPESKIFVIDSYKNFKNNYYSHMERLGYTEISEEFKKIILEGYECYELCIFNKEPGQLFLMYLGISRQDFIDFLDKNKYPEDLLNYYTENNINVNNEVTIIFDTYTKNVIRSGFYGIF